MKGRVVPGVFLVAGLLSVSLAIPAQALTTVTYATAISRSKGQWIYSEASTKRGGSSTISENPASMLYSVFCLKSQSSYTDRACASSNGTVAELLLPSGLGSVVAAAQWNSSYEGVQGSVKVTGKYTY